MRRSLSSVVIALLVAACTSGGSGPGWTLGPSPATQPPASPSASASGAPSGSPAPSASASASAQPSAQPSGSPSGEAIAISAINLQFEQREVAIPAGAPFTIAFDNKDAGQLHNVEIKDQAGATVYRGEIVTGPAQVEYAVPAIAAGSYPFICTVHPTMTGTMTAS